VSALDVTVVVPIDSPDAEVEQVVAAFAGQLERLGKSWECILVFDGVRGKAWERASALEARYPDQLRKLHFARHFGESECLKSAREIARGAVLFTTPQYVQVDPIEIGEFLAELDAGADMVVPWRKGRIDPWLNQLQSASFNWLMRKINKSSFHDLNCYFRAFKRERIAEIELYGDMYRFLPMIAQREGLVVREREVRHLKEWGRAGFFGVGVYARRFLDVVGVVFLTRFRIKPLRFFGSVGLALSLVGGMILAYTIVNRVLTPNYGLQNKPAFLLGLMLFSLGVQVIGFGLVGEIIIYYTQTRNLREYRIGRRFDDEGSDEEEL
jgi:hypothetical protein